MLIQYAVENYKSIKDEVVISFRSAEAYKDSKWAVQDGDCSAPLYKCIGLMGPNASGKTNIIQSFNFALRFIVNTIKRKESSGINVEKFAFDAEMDGKPTSFEFVFYRNKVKYVYGFSISRQEVLEEYLEGYFSEKPKILFERHQGQYFDFGGTDADAQKEMAKKTNPNRLYMPVAAEWGYAPLKEAYQWFVFSSRQYENFNVNSMVNEIIKKEERKKIFIHELQKADFDIKDIYIKNRKMDKKSRDILERFLIELMGENEDFSFSENSPDIWVSHKNSMGVVFEVALREDSAGTESFVQNIAEFLCLSERGGFMLEDELGKNYHAKLMQHFLGMVESPALNPGNTQLLFSTHNTKILGMVNPDQVYLVDKDEAGATIVKLLDDYRISKDDDIELGYLKGRYGGIPYMKG